MKRNHVCWDGWRTAEHWGFWFRVFGYGIAMSTMRPFFSERHGLRRTIRIFGVKVEFLKPESALKH